MNLSKVDKSWITFFEVIENEEWFKNLLNQVEKLYKTEKVFPSYDDVFNVFAMPIDKIKVVLIGQDPYPNENANGYAFASQIKKTQSLLNIDRELKNSYGKGLKHFDLSNLTNQGVFLLNSILTVGKDKPLSHEKLEWTRFTKDAIIYLYKQNKDIVFLLLGNYASKFVNEINVEHFVKTSHPSPLGAYKGFLGSNCFVKVNELLEKLGKAPIDWNEDI